MKERSLYFRGPSADAMVRAVLAGTKTQHRVPVKTPVLAGPPELDWLYPDVEPSRQSYGYWLMDGVACISPFGGPGDRLRIKETFCIESNYNVDDDYDPPFTDRPVKWFEDQDGDSYWEQPHYRATDPTPQLGYQDSEESGPCVRWSPSTHMPRWAERIVRPIKRVWIEHVQDISREGALAEGHAGSGFGPRYDFGRLWDSIYASKGYGFGENPSVWGCEFKKEGN